MTVTIRLGVSISSIKCHKISFMQRGVAESYENLGDSLQSMYQRNAKKIIESFTKMGERTDY